MRRARAGAPHTAEFGLSPSRRLVPRAGYELYFFFRAKRAVSRVTCAGSLRAGGLPALCARGVCRAGKPCARLHRAAATLSCVRNVLWQEKPEGGRATVFAAHVRVPPVQHMAMAEALGNRAGVAAAWVTSRTATTAQSRSST